MSASAFREGQAATRKADVIVQERVIVELKSVETLTALHHAQLLTYMKVSRAEVGLLIN